MSKLARNILVFASSTDCGKTLLSAGLVRAALSQGLECAYIKPVQTGVMSPTDTDASKVASWTGCKHAKTLFEYKDPVSPHLAAERENRLISSFEIRQEILKAMEELKCKVNVVETAGGVLSPFPDRIPAADALELTASRLKFRTVLVGDGRLGGISQTLAALESLEKRNYDVCSLVLFTTDEMEKKWDNDSYLSSHLIQNPPVRRISTPIPQDPSTKIPNDFFTNPVFTDVLNDLLRDDHDKRMI